MEGKEKKQKAPLTIKQQEAWLPEGPSPASPPEAMSPPQPPPWVDLPAEITANILHRLGAIEILETAQKVCTAWRNVCKEPSMWREIDMSNSGNLQDMPYQDLRIMCKHAVDRSQGQLLAINIEYFGTDELLEYIAERSGQLRRLRLACSYDMCYEGLGKAVKSFPLLEELHLFFTEIPSPEVVGSSCPLLKSFTLNRKASGHQGINDAEAYAVAKTMPGLRHLRLFGNEMTNEGLRAILDGCPRLESLDIRQCFNVVLRGELRKRCSEQLKDLRHPHDTTDDYEFDAETSEYDSYDNDISGLSESSGDGYDSEYVDYLLSIGAM